MATRLSDQRLVLALVANTALVGATCLAMSALKGQASYFYNPYRSRPDASFGGRGYEVGGAWSREDS